MKPENLVLTREDTQENCLLVVEPLRGGGSKTPLTTKKKEKKVFSYNQIKIFT